MNDSILKRSLLVRSPKSALFIAVHLFENISHHLRMWLINSHDSTTNCVHNMELCIINDILRNII